MADTELVKRQRRNCKYTIARYIKDVEKLIELARTSEEVESAMDKVMASYQETAKCHNELMLLIEDDECDEEQKWLDEYHDRCFNLQLKAREYTLKCKATVAHNTVAAQTNDVTGDSVGGADSANQSQIPAVNMDNLTENIPTENRSHSVNTGLTDSSSNTAPVIQNRNNNAVLPGCAAANEACAFQVERPKLPKFDGNVREYLMFRSDFRHVVESKYSERDSIALLRTCLMGEPLEMIIGMGNDYQGAWTYLDSIYGDARFISDTVTQDIVRFKPLREGEDARYCELVQLVRKSFNTLKEVNRKKRHGQ